MSKPPTGDELGEPAQQAAEESERTKAAAERCSWNYTAPLLSERRGSDLVDEEPGEPSLPAAQVTLRSPGCFVTHEEFLVYRIQIDAVIADLKKRLGILDKDDDGQPCPPGTWVMIKEAAARREYSESGIRALIKRGIAKRRRSNGKVLVNLDTVPLR